MIEMDIKQLFFNNLHLLGFDAPAMEAANHIPFNKTMFNLPNKRGAEIVLYFLFQRLNPGLCKDFFRDCWPILDKKKEQLFRKTCYNWLSSIAQEEPDCHLPRINASLFMSPGGDKFYQLLFHFSGYVLNKVLDNELGGSKHSERMKYPSLTSQNTHLAEVMMKGLSCSSVRHRKAYFEAVQLTLRANNTWKESVDDYVREYRRLTKDLRELDYKLREEDQRSVEASRTRGSPVKRSDHGDDLDPDFDPRTIKRAQRIQQVRDMWKQLDDFDRTEAAEREIVESIVERTVNKYRLDASEISVKVPDMLLRECGQEIRKRNVDNTYQGGKLNLVSVLQLWNLCLHLYLEKLQQVGVPKFEQEVQQLTSQVHVQLTYQQNTHTLRQQMSERIPKLKASIEKLREKLDSELFQEESPSSLRTTSVGLGLVGPSPLVSFSPKEGDTPGGLVVPRSPTEDTTPEAAGRISEQVKASVRCDPKQLFQEDLLAQQPKKPGPSSIPQSSQPGSRHSSRPSSGRSTSSRGGKSSKKSTPRPAETNNKDAEEFMVVKSPRTMMESLDQSQGLGNLSARSNVSVASSKTLTPRSDKSGSMRGQGDYQSPRSQRSQGQMSRSQVGQGDGVSPRSQISDVETSSRPGRQTPTDYLVAEIMGEGEILSPFNSGLEAFETRETVRRTPDLVQDDQIELQEVDEQLDEEDKENIEPPAEGGEVMEGEFEEILGPELEEEYDNEDAQSVTSQLSVEQIIVIDRSIIHESPSLAGPEVQEDPLLAAEEEGVALLEEEEFPNLETSPREAIVINRSLTKPPIGEVDERLSKVGMSSPRVRQQSTDAQLSMSLQSPYTPNEKKTLLSRSLIIESSPLKDEIRKMFKEALADTPPKGTRSRPSDDHMFSDQGMSPAGSSRVSGILKDDEFGTPGRRRYGSTGREEVSDDDLEQPNMDPESREGDGTASLSSGVLREADISWELTENLEDIQMPDLGLGRESDIGLMPRMGEASAEEEEIDDFFKSKTPELPKRSAFQDGSFDNWRKERSQVEEPGLGSPLGGGDIPEFLLSPQRNLEDPSPLISFTP